MLRLDHITVIAPTLSEGVDHVRNCLDLDVPSGTRHAYMGTHNHRLRLGDRIYLEIIAPDPEAADPGRPRWFGLDDQRKVRADWDAGQRLRGWVASTEEMGRTLSDHPRVFGEMVELPPDAPEFAFSIPPSGTLPLDGAAPSLIDHRSAPTSMDDIPDLGARLASLTLCCPHPEAVVALYRRLHVDRAPSVRHGDDVRYVAQIDTPNGPKELT